MSPLMRPFAWDTWKCPTQLHKWQCFTVWPRRTGRRKWRWRSCISEQRDSIFFMLHLHIPSLSCLSISETVRQGWSWNPCFLLLLPSLLHFPHSAAFPRNDTLMWFICHIKMPLQTCLGLCTISKKWKETAVSSRQQCHRSSAYTQLAVE